MFRNVCSQQYTVYGPMSVKTKYVFGPTDATQDLRSNCHLEIVDNIQTSMLKYLWMFLRNALSICIYLDRMHWVMWIISRLVNIAIFTRKICPGVSWCIYGSLNTFSFWTNIFNRYWLMTLIRLSYMWREQLHYTHAYICIGG